jgi:pimeloyl-ACP methyl ester carboxylesterase
MIDAAGNMDARTREPAKSHATPRKKGLGYWLKRVGLALLTLLLLLVAAGLVYQLVATAIDNGKYPAPGQLVDVGGYNLHISCTGQGSPAVILDASSIDTSSSWAWVQPEVAKSTRVCSYDRAGLGWSDLGPAPRDAQQHSSELHTLLQRGGIAGPYVLVGHSYGGLITRVYADRYPGEVAGVVLVEALHPDFQARQGKAEVMPNTDPAMLAAGRFLSRLGFTRLVYFGPSLSDYPPQQQAELKAYYSTTKYTDLAQALSDGFAATLAQVRATHSLGSKPLAVVVGSASENSTGVLGDLQAELVGLSSNSVLRTVPGADHEGLVHKQGPALETAGYILQVVEAVRAGRPLSP